METISVDKAKESLEDLIARAARGEEVVIVDPVHGKAMLTVVRSTHGRPRVSGRSKARIPTLPDEFFAPLSGPDLKDWCGDQP